MAEAPGAPTVGMPSPRQMVLVHGAWQGRWAWDAFVPELNRLGWQAHAVDLPGNGCDPHDHTRPADVSLNLYVAFMCQVLSRFDAPVVLVAHSGGGVIASQVAEAVPDKLACLVHLAGMMLPSGLSYRALVAACQSNHPALDFSGITPHLRWSSDELSSEVPADAARSIFLHDADDATAAQAIARLRPQPERGRAIAPHLTAERHGRVPRIYAEALADRSLQLPLQRRMQELSPGARRLAVDCGHMPHVVQPRQLAERLCAELDSLFLSPSPTVA